MVLNSDWVEGPVSHNVKNRGGVKRWVVKQLLFVAIFGRISTWHVRDGCIVKFIDKNDKR